MGIFPCMVKFTLREFDIFPDKVMNEENAELKSDPYIQVFNWKCADGRNPKI